MNDKKLQLKQNIIECLNLDGFRPEDIDDEEPLFGEGLGLDSVDALEIILMLEKVYGVKFEAAADARPHLKNINSIAELVK